MKVHTLNIASLYGFEVPDGLDYGDEIRFEVVAHVDSVTQERVDVSTFDKPGQWLPGATSANLVAKEFRLAISDRSQD